MKDLHLSQQSNPYLVSDTHRINGDRLHNNYEQQILLTVSNVIATLSERQDLLQVAGPIIKKLFQVNSFAIAYIEEKGYTYQMIIPDGEPPESNCQPGKDSGSFTVADHVMGKILQTADPILFDVSVLIRCQGVPAYIQSWFRAGDRYILAWRLRVGGSEIGAVFLRAAGTPLKQLDRPLFKAVFAQIAVAVANILAHERLDYYKKLLKREEDPAREPQAATAVFPQVIGSSPAMQHVYKLMSMVAKADSTVLLLGETGSGKEVIATAIHKASARHDKPMIKVNCAALPANLIESELFGHERGAFTGATDRRVGKFELAHQGTIFLDEIGEIPVEVQVKLLRVLQEREIERIGGKTTIKINVRVIAATNRDLEAEIKAGRFRADLFYRLHVFPIPLPPLRQRKEDIATLATFFLERYSKATGKKVTGIATNLLQAMEAYPWPGNVRELEHLIERSVLLTRDTLLKEITLPQVQSEEEKMPMPEKSLQEMERSYIIQALRKYNGRIGGADGAAHFLDIPATTLHSKIKKLAILKKDYVN